MEDPKNCYNCSVDINDLDEDPEDQITWETVTNEACPPFDRETTFQDPIVVAEPSSLGFGNLIAI
jgi:hypothetical protein